MRFLFLGCLFISSLLIADEPTFTIDAKVLDFDGDSQVLKAQDVVIGFKNGAKLMSRHAEMDFDSIHGVMSSGEGNELVIFTGFTNDENNEPRPIIVKGKIMMVGIEEDEHQKEMIEVTAEGSVEILYDEDFTAYGDRAVFRNEKQDELTSLTRAGLLVLEGGDRNCPCRIEHKNGDVIEASRMSFLPSENQVDGWDVQGSITSVGKMRVIDLSSEHVRWFPRKKDLLFSGKTIISDDEVGSLTNLGTIEIFRDNKSDKATLKEVVASGEVCFEHNDGEHVLGGFGKMILNLQEQKLILMSPKNENGLVAPSQQAFYQDSIGKIYANQFVINYEVENGAIQPSHVLVKGHIRMQNQFIPDPNIQNMLEQYAIADVVKYSPKTKQMTLIANRGKRVLYYDKSKGMQVSASGLHVTRGTKGNWEVQGKGNVRMKFTQHEVIQLQEYFPFLR